MGSSRKEEKKERSVFISVRVCLLHSCFYSTNKSSSYFPFFFLLVPTFQKKKFRTEMFIQGGNYCRHV